MEGRDNDPLSWPQKTQMEDKDNDPLSWPQNTLTKEQTMEKIQIIQRYCLLLEHRYGKNDYKFRHVYESLHHVLMEFDAELWQFCRRKSFDNYYIEPLYRLYKYGFNSQDGPDRPNEEKSRDQA